MSYNFSEITHDDSIKIGSDDAELKIVEYINLRCPHCKNYEEKVAPFLDEYIENGSVQRILKHWDKAKYPLETGSVLNQYLDYDKQEEAFEVIQKLFADQDTWGAERLSDMPHVAKEYGLSLQEENRERAKRVSKEVEAVNVEFVPTVFVGEEAFVEISDPTGFKEAVENYFK